MHGLCTLSSIPLLPELEQLAGRKPICDGAEFVPDNFEESEDAVSEEDTGFEDLEDDIQMEEDVKSKDMMSNASGSTSSSESATEYEGIATNNIVTLEKLKHTQRQSYLKGQVCGSVLATDRLMKELRDVYRSDANRNGHYTVELVGDSLYEWHVKLLRVDQDSLLFHDLQQLKSKDSSDGILLSFLFKVCATVAKGLMRLCVFPDVLFFYRTLFPLIPPLFVW